MKKSLLVFLSICLLAGPVAYLPFVYTVNSALADGVQQEIMQAQIDALVQQKNEVDGIINELSGKPAEMRAFQQTLMDTYKNLAQMKIRLKGIQLWNGFVAFTSVALDSLQKVNPGSSIVGFVSSQTMDAIGRNLPNPPFQAKLNRLASEINNIAPSLRQLDRAINMNNKEVADELVYRQMVDNSWVNLYNRTPEAVAESKSVITGKITFIQERIEPAMKDLYRAKLSTEESIAELALVIDGLKEKSRDLERQIANLKRQTAREKIIEEVHESVKIEEGEDEEEGKELVYDYTYSGSPMEPHMALSVMEDAFNALRSHASTYNEYLAVRLNMEDATNLYLDQEVRKLYQKLSQSNGNEMTHEDLAKARLELVQKREDEFLKPMGKLGKDEELPRFQEFISRLEDFLKTPYNPSGDYWASTVWAHVPKSITRFHDVYLGQTHTISDPAEGSAVARDVVRMAEELISSTLEAEDQIRGRLRQAEELAHEIETNLELWIYVRGLDNRPLNNYTEYVERLPEIKGSIEIFDRYARIFEQEARRELEWLKQEMSRAGQSYVALASRPKLIEEARETIESWSKAQTMSAGNALNQEGSNASQFFQNNNVNRERTEELRKTVEKLQKNPKEIESHVLKEVAGNGPLAPSTEKLRTLQQEYSRQKNAIAERRSAYIQYQEKYQKSYSALEAKLFNLQSQLTTASPRLASSFSVEEIMAEAGQKEPMSGWGLPDPADLPQPDLSDDVLIQEFAVVAAQYNELVDLYRDKAKKRYETARGKMQQYVNQAMIVARGPAISPDEFEGQVVSLASEAKIVYEPLAFLDNNETKTDLAADYQVFQAAIGKAREEYLELWRNKVYNKLDTIREEHRKGGLADQERADEYSQELREIIAPESFADRMREDRQVANLIEAVHEMLDLLNQGANPLSAVSDFYNAFKQAYETRNESLVMSFISDDWTAAGGVTLFDLEENLRNMFSVFDEVEYQLSGLSVQPAEAGRYKASYQVSINGRNFDNDLLHEESSEVSEIVEIGPDRKLKILRTQSGRYW